MKNWAGGKYSFYLAHDFFLTRSINFERTFLLKERTALGGRIGLGNDYGNRNLSGIAEILFLYGKKRHYLEIGIGYQQPFYYFESGPDPPALALMVGYRFIGRNGFLFKIYPEFIPAIFPDPESYGSLPFLGLALGYSF